MNVGQLLRALKNVDPNSTVSVSTDKYGDEFELVEDFAHCVYLDANGDVIISNYEASPCSPNAPILHQDTL